MKRDRPSLRSAVVWHWIVNRRRELVDFRGHAIGLGSMALCSFVGGALLGVRCVQCAVEDTGRRPPEAEGIVDGKMAAAGDDT